MTSPTELRVQCRLAWNNWPDNESSRREIAAHEARDKHSADAWDRVIAKILAARLTISALPEIPDDDADFTPALARQIVERYHGIISNYALVAQRIEHGDSTSGVAGSNPAERAKLFPRQSVTTFDEGAASGSADAALSAPATTRRTAPGDGGLNTADKGGAE